MNGKLSEWIGGIKMRSTPNRPTREITVGASIGPVRFYPAGQPIDCLATCPRERQAVLTRIARQLAQDQRRGDLPLFDGGRQSQYLIEGCSISFTLSKRPIIDSSAGH